MVILSEVEGHPKRSRRPFFTGKGFDSALPDTSFEYTQRVKIK